MAEVRITVRAASTNLRAEERSLRRKRANHLAAVVRRAAVVQKAAVVRRAAGRPLMRATAGERNKFPRGRGAACLRAAAPSCFRAWKMEPAVGCDLRNRCCPALRKACSRPWKRARG